MPAFPRDPAARLRLAAAGRREYRDLSAPTLREPLAIEAASYDMAASLITDDAALSKVLPSWMMITELQQKMVPWCEVHSANADTCGCPEGEYERVHRNCSTAGGDICIAHNQGDDTFSSTGYRMVTVTVPIGTTENAAAERTAAHRLHVTTGGGELEVHCAALHCDYFQCDARRFDIATLTALEQEHHADLTAR